MENRSEGCLNPYQRRHLLVTMAHIDGQLSDIEQALAAAGSQAPFPKYLPDVTPAQRKTIEDYFDRIRARLLRVLQGQGMEPDPPSIPVSRAVRTTLTFVDIAIEELRPQYMHDYGEVPAEAAVELEGIAGELAALVRQLNRYVAQSGRDLKQRLEKLEKGGGGLELLKLLERIVGSHGLVEFRSALEMVLSRLEDQSFEIAVFGGVSTGKSSLLNAIVGEDILPVGVTPITAVPTRLAYGNSAGLVVWVSDRAPERYDIGRLRDFASEPGNPGNRKHVSRMLVQWPAGWLKDGVVLVDTPGLGSVATNGAAETMAYLPRCDLAVVLIDAAAALSSGDVHLVETLYQAGIPAQVLLSKADLLAPQDLEKVIRYTAEQLCSALGSELTVHPVSIMGEKRELLGHWFDREILPLFAHRQELRSASVRRKIGTLRQAVEMALRSRLRRPEPPAGLKLDIQEFDSGLRRVTALVEETRTATRRIVDSLSRSAPAVFERAAQRLVALWRENPAADSSPVVRETAMEVAQAHAKAIQESLLELAQRLEEQLGWAAQTLGTPNRPAPQELQLLLREMPVWDPASIAAAIGRPRALALLGTRVAVRRMTRRLSEALQPSLPTLLDLYGRVLRAWSESILDQMQRRFAAYADAYRAQAERSAGNAYVSSEDCSAIDHDLALLAAVSDTGLLPEPAVASPARPL